MYWCIRILTIKIQSINPQLSRVFKTDYSCHSSRSGRSSTVRANWFLRAPSLSLIVFGCLWIPCCNAWSAWSFGATIWVALLQSHLRAPVGWSPQQWSSQPSRVPRFHSGTGTSLLPNMVRVASSCPSIAQSVALLAWFESMSRPMLSGSTKSVRMCMLVGATNDLVFKALMLSHYYWFFTLRPFHKGLFHIVTSSSFDYLEDTGNGVGSFSLHLLSVNLGNGWYHPTLALEHYKWSDLIKATS